VKIPALAVLFLLLASGASSLSGNIPDPEEDALVVENYSSLSPGDVGKTFLIPGLLEKTSSGSAPDSAPGAFTLTANHESRSRVTFTLELDAKQAKRAEKLAGKTVRVKGVLTGADAVWSKTLRVIEITGEK
jgi:beta-lactamase regulating signal transducer with metallopeptidase domain